MMLLYTFLSFSSTETSPSYHDHEGAVSNRLDCLVYRWTLKLQFSMKSYSLLILSLIIVAIIGCSKKNEPVSPGNDPNFTIEANADGILKRYNRKVVVFGIDIYAVPLGH